MNYLYISNNNNIVGKGTLFCTNSSLNNIEVSQAIFDDYETEKYIYQDGEVILNPQWEEIVAEREAERIGNLSMTRGDVFEAMILARNLSKTEIREMIEEANIPDDTKALYLNRFDEALEFYRKYPLFNLIGARLNISTTNLDNFFKTKDWHYLAEQST